MQRGFFRKGREAGGGEKKKKGKERKGKGTRKEEQTHHFSVNALGSQLWLMNRPRFPLREASMTKLLSRVRK